MPKSKRILRRSKKSEWDKVADFWDEESGDQGGWHQRHDIDPVMRRVLGPVRKRRVLELGCGNGYFSRWLAKAGARVTAIDYSPRFIALCEAREKRDRLGIRFMCRDAAKLTGLPTRHFGLVVANMMLMDVKKFVQVFQEASRVLQPGGRFVFSIVHPIYSDWQHATARYQGKLYYARILKKYLSETGDDRMHWGNGTSTSHYHRPVQSYIRAINHSAMVMSDFVEIASSRPMVRAPRQAKRLTHQKTWHYLSAQDRQIKLRRRNEIPMFLVIGTTKVKT